MLLQTYSRGGSCGDQLRLLPLLFHSIQRVGLKLDLGLHLGLYLGDLESLVGSRGDVVTACHAARLDASSTAPLLAIKHEYLHEVHA